MAQYRRQITPTDSETRFGHLSLLHGMDPMGGCDRKSRDSPYSYTNAIENGINPRTVHRAIWLYVAGCSAVFGAVTRDFLNDACSTESALMGGDEGCSLVRAGARPSERVLLNLLVCKPLLSMYVSGF